MNAEAHLKQDIGLLVANLLFQIAVLKAEIDGLKAQLAKAPEHADNHEVGR